MRERFLSEAETASKVIFLGILIVTILAMVLVAPVAAEASLDFRVTVSSWSQGSGLTRVSSGSISVLGADGETFTGSIGTGGGLTFQVPADQAATWTLSVGGFEDRTLRSEIVDGLLHIYDADTDDAIIEYAENGDGSYSLEYYSGFLYICGPADDNAPLMGRTFEPQDAIAQNKARARSMLAELPLSFEQNRGQLRAGFDFLAKTQGLTVLLRPDQAVINIQGSRRDGLPKDRYQTRQNILMRVRDADGTAKPVGEKRLAGKVNYFIGRQENWKTGIPTYGRVRFEQVYPGIDLAYYGRGRALEYDFIVAPGADPSRIALSFEGQSAIKLDDDGNLVLAAGSGNVVKKRPFIYQEVGGKRQQVQGEYKLLAENAVGFELDEYDKTLPLIIDPVVEFSTFLGGSNNDSALGCAVDSAGAVYVVGSTQSNDFPTTAGAYDQSYNGGGDGFITKIAADGSSLIYSTYLGGAANNESANGIAVDSSGAAYVAGRTWSNDFPMLNPIDNVFAGSSEVFVSKLSADGSALIYSTYLGGTGSENGEGIAVDSSGQAHVCGWTDNNSYPLQGAVDNTFAGVSEGFVSKLNAAGSALIYSTFLGGSAGESADDIDLDPSGNAYVVGYTSSADFPTTAGAYQQVYGTNEDIWVAKLPPDGSALTYCTYLGGTESNEDPDIAVDTGGAAYLVQTVTGTGHPITAGAYDQTYDDNDDLVVAKLSPDGSTLVYATYLGRSESEGDGFIDVDSSGSAWVAGRTRSPDFPLQDPVYGTLNVAAEVFVTKLNPTGSGLEFSTYLPGNDSDGPDDIALNQSGEIAVVGYTQSPDFPLVNAVDSTFAGANEGFVTKFLDLTSTSGLPPGGPYGFWGGGRELMWTENCWDISALIAACLAAGGDCELSFAWPFSFGTDPTTTETEDGDLAPLNSAMPFLVHTWTYPDGSSETTRLAIGRDTVTGSGISCVTGLGQDVGVQHVALKQTLPGSLVSALESGTHTLTYRLMDTDGNYSNQRTQTLVLE